MRVLISEIVRGVVLMIVVIWTAAMAVPLLQLGADFVDGINSGLIYTQFDEVTVTAAFLSVELAFVIVVDYFLVRLTARRTGILLVTEVKVQVGDYKGRKRG